MKFKQIFNIINFLIKNSEREVFISKKAMYKIENSKNKDELLKELYDIKCF